MPWPANHAFSPSGTKNGVHQRLRREPSHRLAIEVVVVIVRQDRDINMRQIAKPERGRDHAPGPDEAERRRAFGQVCVGQDVDAVELQQKCCMPDPGECGLGAIGLEPSYVGVMALEMVSASGTGSPFSPRSRCHFRSSRVQSVIAAETRARYDGVCCSSDSCLVK